ncbi:MAG: SDR family oxidoreductase [Gammaproteobacteria bacterium]|nr:SDR family oxidoreductase [Gammaproteobacteria bacterium]MDD9894933.1 SDR family oxidoreductase [Gammaproteobacteria bacterium]MDD9958811.1 SDR family oxidoreductase [Gammaproteobacteria bacterium]
MATVLVIGANRGIGLEFTKQFLARGDKVIGTCRDGSADQELNRLQAEQADLQLLTLDVSSDESIAAFPAQLGDTAVDIFINNAGVYGPRDSVFGNVDEQNWLPVLRINSIAPMLLTQSIIKNLRKGQDKKLLYVTSKMGSIDDNKGGGSYIYRSSKAALNAIVKSISVDLSTEGFTAAVLHPGWVQTDMGGPNALIDAQTSVSGMISVIDNLSSSHAGCFFNYDGDIIPW